LILGIGGSATNDGGFGVARGIGWKFFDDRDQEITSWVKLSRLTRLEPPATPLPGVEFIVAVDVENPLLGLNGCTRVYGPQKGLLPQQAPVAESALERLAARVQSASGVDVAAEAGAGAAGGLGFGLRSFFGAQLYSGFDLFAEAARLDERIRAVDLVITGEGAIDRQSLMGKGTGRLAQRCRALEKRCIGLAGVVEGAAKSPTADRLFHAVHSITPTLTSPAEARKDAALWLQRLANRVGTDYFDS
jgi:glycerate kinase